MKIEPHQLAGRIAHFTLEQAQKAFDYARAGSDNIFRSGETIVEAMQRHGIGWAFYWDETEEGWDYWKALNSGKEPAESTPAPAEFKIRRADLTGRLANFTKDQARRAFQYARVKSLYESMTDEELLEFLKSGGIGFAFRWNATDEGFDYWKALSEGYSIDDTLNDWAKQTREALPALPKQLSSVNIGDKVYAPSQNTGGHIVLVWEDSYHDKLIRETVGVFGTPKEAKQVSKVLKEFSKIVVEQTK